VKLNIGCGKRKVAGYINCDIDERVGPDVLFDISQGWPFKDNSAKVIKAENILEHIAGEDLIGTMREIHRVLKPGGRLEAIVPYWTGRWAVADPGHKTLWNEYMLRWFIDPEYRQKVIGPRVDFYFKLNKLLYRFFADASEKWPTPEERKFARQHYLNVVDSMVFILRKPK
jgi:ubiquinone/menaquinone biosynthesis C-methylase UbiE